MDKILEKLKNLEKKVGNEILVISDFSRLIFEQNINKSDLEKFFKKFINIFYNDERSIIFPAFISPGINQKIINLDNARSITGIFSELFRNFNNVKRTESPYFSYCILGKEQENFLKINPLYEWSDNSHLGWMEKKNVSCLILGSYPANNPLVHRVEYKNKELIKYRQLKKFTNQIIYQGKKKIHTQYFFELKKNFNNMNKYYMQLFNNEKNIELDQINVENFKIFQYKADLLFKIYENQILKNEIFQNGLKKTT